MSDLNEVQASQSVKIAGAGPTSGIEDNWADVDANGNLFVTLDNSPKQTYAAAITGLVAGAAATDFFTISGSGSKTIRVLKIGFSCTQTNPGYENFIVLKRSTANTGGTSTAQTAVPMDSNSAEATASVLAYTANPTALGTLVGNIRSYRMLIETTPTGGVSSTDIAMTALSEISFGGIGQAPVLRGTSQLLSVNFAAGTATGNLINIFIEWSEE